MKTISLNLYSFQELSPEAQTAAIEKHQHINTNFDWWDSVYDQFNEDAQNYFDIDNIYFSGFWSQGDGAMFEYSSINPAFIDEIINGLDLPTWKKQILSAAYITGTGQHSGHYYHSGCCRHNIDYDYYQFNQHPNLHDFVNDQFNEIEKLIRDKYKDLCSELYRNLEREYEYLTGPEAIKETLICNEYEFTSDGEMY